MYGHSIISILGRQTNLSCLSEGEENNKLIPLDLGLRKIISAAFDVISTPDLDFIIQMKSLDTNINRIQVESRLHNGTIYLLVLFGPHLAASVLGSVGLGT